MRIMATEYKVFPGAVPVHTFLVVNFYNQSFEEDDRILVPNVKFSCTHDVYSCPSSCRRCGGDRG